MKTVFKTYYYSVVTVSPLTTVALFAAVWTGALAHTLTALRLTLAICTQHVPWLARGCTWVYTYRKNECFFFTQYMNTCKQMNKNCVVKAEQICLLHLASSRPSEQSFTPSQTFLRGIQRPSPHRNWRGHAGHIGKEFTRFSLLCPI